ncbi:MAG: hypothetical protein V8Q17_03920 [Acutalibacteraceae bacterium]
MWDFIWGTPENIIPMGIGQVYHVYRRRYYKNQEFIDYTNNATPGQEPRPEGYPTNDVGGDADGKLSSYNAGTYTYPIMVKLFNVR